MTHIEKEKLLKYIQNYCTAEEYDEITEWRNLSEDNERFIADIEYLWELSKYNKNDLEKITGKEWDSFDLKLQKNSSVSELSGNRFYKNLIRITQVAAALVILSWGISWLFFNQSPFKKPTNENIVEFSTPKGSRSFVLLPDGTKVWLNAGSNLSFPGKFEDKTREVYLEGEAYFNVVKNEQQPLIVKTSDIYIKVLGTRFNVKAYPGEKAVETTLEKGLITIGRNNDGFSNPLISLKPNQKAVFLKKEGEIMLNDLSEKSKVKSPIDQKGVRSLEKIIVNEKVETSVYTSWKDGNLIFESEKFIDMEAKLERWFNVEIILKDKELENIEFTANFKNENIVQVLEALKITHPFEYTFDNKTNIVTID